MNCPECLWPHSPSSACGPAFQDVCVICEACIGPEDSGLCDAHKYDEQLAERDLRLGLAVPAVGPSGSET